MKQPSDVFRTMTSEESVALLTEMRDELRPLYKQLENVAAATLRLRPVFLGRQPFPKRCNMIRKAMALKVNSEAASELLASFFLERYSAELGQLLDGLGVEHEEGVLKENNPAAPDSATLSKVVKEFAGGEKPEIRSVLLKTFAAQPAVDWPELEALVFPGEEGASESAPTKAKSQSGASSATDKPKAKAKTKGKAKAKTKAKAKSKAKTESKSSGAAAKSATKSSTKTAAKKKATKASK